MPAEKVTPEKWSEPLILFDNGSYSVIAGTQEGKRKLGARWNNDTDSVVNLPIMSGYAAAFDAIWHIIPSFLELPVLHGLVGELARDPSGQVGINRIDWILQELRSRYYITQK
jgi:hypothetical protein